jgi:hypothetical protein
MTLPTLHVLGSCRRRRPRCTSNRLGSHKSNCHRHTSCCRSRRPDTRSCSCPDRTSSCTPVRPRTPSRPASRQALRRTHRSVAVRSTPSSVAAMPARHKQRCNSSQEARRIGSWDPLHDGRYQEPRGRRAVYGGELVMTKCSVLAPFSCACVRYGMSTGTPSRSTERT